MDRFVFTGFADEIDSSLDVQMTVLERLGIRQIEMRGVDGKNLTDYTLEESAEIKRRLDQRGFSLSAIGSPIGKIKITDPFTEHPEKFRHVLEQAKLFGTPYIRLFSFFIPQGEDPARYRDEVLARMQAFLDAAQGYDVILLHENEKDIYGDTPERCLDLLETLHHPKLFATFDPANFVQCGVEVFPHAYNLLAPYLRYMHIKDALFKDGSVVPAGQGDGRVYEVLSALVATDYHGYLSLEPHLGDFVGYSALEHSGTEKDRETKGSVLFEIAYKALMALLEKGGWNE